MYVNIHTLTNIENKNFVYSIIIKYFNITYFK